MSYRAHKTTFHFHCKALDDTVDMTSAFHEVQAFLKTAAEKQGFRVANPRLNDAINRGVIMRFDVFDPPHKPDGVDVGKVVFDLFEATKKQIGTYASMDKKREDSAGIKITEAWFDNKYAAKDAASVVIG